MHSRPTLTYRLALSFCLLLLLLPLSLCLGAKPIALSTVWDSLFGQALHADALIIREARLPRTLLGVLAGAALGLAGTIMQAITRNPLADPGILGVNAGASFAVVLGVAFFGVTSNLGYLSFALAGACLTALLVYFVASVGSAAKQLEPLRFILAGIAISAVLMGFSTSIALVHPQVFDRVRFWNAGSLDIRELTLVLQLAPILLLGMLLALALARPLNALAMGQDLAVALGIQPLWIHTLAVLCITILCGTATALAGPIGFVGLMIPLIARWLVGADLRWMMAASIVLAPSLLLASDIIGRVLSSSELRVSIVTAFVGAPVLIWLARRTH